VHPTAEQIDWHSLVRSPASYAVDLAPSSTTSANRSALVLGDPAEALPSSREEAERVAELLRARKWSVDQRHVVSRSVLREAMERDLELFHYSGHGVVRGAEGLHGGLPLQAEEYFSVADVLTLKRAPRAVVLSACSLAQGAPGSESIGMSMAHAFLLRGSQVVIAAPREVSGRTARAIVETAHQKRLEGASWADAVLAGEQTAREKGLDDPGVFRVISRR
jgi:CHAT domain-containing protein